MVRDEIETKAQLQSKSIRSSPLKTELNILGAGQKQAEQALRNSEEKYRRLFISSPIGMAIHDLEGEYLEVNDTYAKILGIPKKALLGKVDVALTQDKKLEITREDIDELFSKGVTGGVKELQIHDNHHILSYVDTLLYDNDKKPVGIISTIQDITELSKPEPTLQRKLDHPERMPDKMPKSPMKSDTELIEVHVEHRSFNPFKVIPRKIEQDMKYEFEHSRRRPKFKGLFGRFLHKSFELDDFMHELGAETAGRREFKGDEDEAYP